MFAEQAAGLIDGGADLIIIETAQDILEVKAAVFGAREAFKTTGRTLPIHTSVSLLPNGGKMLLGTDISAVLDDAGGAEGRRDRPELLDRPGGHARRDPLPRRVLPGARRVHPQRRPALQGPDGETIFPEQPEPLADALEEFVERYGVGIVGGCCGTTPAHIAAIVERVAGATRAAATPGTPCSPTCPR